MRAVTVTGGNVQGMRGGVVHEGNFALLHPRAACRLALTGRPVSYHPTTKAVTCKRCLALRAAAAEAEEATR